MLWMPLKIKMLLVRLNLFTFYQIDIRRYKKVKQLIIVIQKPHKSGLYLIVD